MRTFILFVFNCLKFVVTVDVKSTLFNLLWAFTIVTVEEIYKRSRTET